MSLRRGRPATIKQEGADFSINVAGNIYTFRQGNDGRLRPTGKTKEFTKNADYDYALGRIRVSLAQAG